MDWIFPIDSFCPPPDDDEEEDEAQLWQLGLGGGGSPTPAGFVVVPPIFYPHRVKDELPLCFKADESANERSELVLDSILLFDNERLRKHRAFSYEKVISRYYAVRGGLDIFT
jgi:hypothetical protein